MSVQNNHLAIPKSVFRRIVKDEIAPQKGDGKDYLITREALAMLQGAAEKHMVDMFGAATRQSAAEKRVTLRVIDIETARKMAAIPQPNTIGAYDAEMDTRLVDMGEEEEEEAALHSCVAG
jgi:histone H3/H4